MLSQSRAVIIATLLFGYNKWDKMLDFVIDHSKTQRVQIHPPCLGKNF